MNWLKEKHLYIVSTQGAAILDRDNIEDRNTNNNSDNNLNLNDCAHAENELPDIDQPISDSSYPSNSAFSFNYENESYDKTPDFEPEWDPGWANVEWKYNE